LGKKDKKGKRKGTPSSIGRKEKGRESSALLVRNLGFFGERKLKGGKGKVSVSSNLPQEERKRKSPELSQQQGKRKGRGEKPKLSYREGGGKGKSTLLSKKEKT